MLRQVAVQASATLPQVVYARMAQTAPAVIPLVAASNPEQMAENLAAANLVLTAHQMARLDAAGASAEQHLLTGLCYKP